MNIEEHKLWSPLGHLNRDQAEFIQELSLEHKPKYCLETGFCTGRSSLALILGNEDGIEKFITIDWNFDYNKNCQTPTDVLASCHEYVDKFKAKYNFYSEKGGNTADVLNKEFLDKEFPNGIDWFTVDGDHTYDGCKRDLTMGLPYMNQGSIIIIDDYEAGPPNGCHIPEVNQACYDFYSENSDKLTREKWNKLGKGFCIFRVK